MVKGRRSVWLPIVSAVALVLGSALPAAAGPSGNVLRYRPRTQILKVLKADGSRTAYQLDGSTRIRLVAPDGTRARGSVNDLVFGAGVRRIVVEDGTITRVKLAMLEGGSTDCSFDFSSDDDGEGDRSWDCSFDYEAGDRSESQDVSFDASFDGDASGGSSDVSWDASSDTTIGDDVDDSWDCSFDASADWSGDATEGDLSADSSFDCSWTGAGFDASFDPDVMAWTVTATETGETFGCVFDPATVSWDCSVDFSVDYVPEVVDVGGNVSCTGDGAGGYTCGFVSEVAAGECDVDVSLDETTGPEGDLSGDVSLSCWWGPIEDL